MFPSSRPPLRVLVIGAGLGGLCLAHGLRQAGLAHVDVFERARVHHDPLQSYRIHINPTGSRALHACLPTSVWQAIVAHAARPPRGIAFVTHTLQPLTAFDEPPSSAPDARSLPISRAGLRTLLLDGLEDVVHFDKRCVGYDLGADGQVLARFADGTTATGDVLVGADGAGSVVRRQYLPQARVEPTGVVGIAGKLRLDDADTAGLPLDQAAASGPSLEQAAAAGLPLSQTVAGGLPASWLEQMTMVVPPRGLGMFVAPFRRAAADVPWRDDVDLPDHIFWALIGRPAQLGLAAAERSEDGRALQRQAAAAVADWHPAIRQLIAASDPNTLLSVPLHTSAPVPAWPSSRVTLLGDAIHTMTPLQGLGGNTALQDAARLVAALGAVQRGEMPLPEAIGAYEAALRHDGFAAVRQSLQVTTQLASTNALARLAFTSVLRLADHVGPLHRRLFRRPAAA